MQAVAKARYVRTSPRKARLVIDLIRGKDVKEALGILQFTPNFAARLIEKVVKSAVANAENNNRMDGDNLKVAVATVDGGPNSMKRLRYAPQGRGYRIVKRMSHITIIVEETEPKPEKKPRRGAAAKAAKAPRAAKAPKVPTKPVEAAAAAEAKVEAPKPKRAPRKKKSDGDTEAKGGE
jgi:large subunit ribosomal protein L22